MAKDAIVIKTKKRVKVYIWKANPDYTQGKSVWIDCEDCNTKYNNDELQFLS